MERTMKRYGANHRFSTSYHPQTSSQVENTNIAFKSILKKTIKDNLAIWSRKLDDALWAFRTAYKTPTSTTPYKLIYGKNCHLPFKIEHRAYRALKNCNPYLIAVGEKRMFQLHELNELRHQAYENSRLYKARTKIWHDRKLRMRKEFKQGNKVLLFRSKYKFKQPKLRSRWLGPYIVKHQYPSRYVELYEKDRKKFIVNGHRLKLYHEEDNDPKEAVISAAFLSDESSAMIQNKVPPKLRDPGSFLIPYIQKQLNLGVGTEGMIFNIDYDEGSKILHSIKGTLLEEEIFSEFNEFMAMTADENSESESDTEEPQFEKITINSDYKIKTSPEEPPTDLKLKPLPDNLEYVFLEEPFFLPVIISSKLSAQNKSKLVSILKKHKEAFAWKTTDIPGICPSFYKHKIQLLDDKKPVVQKQRRLDPNMQEVVKKEIMKLLDTDIIYPIVNSPWVSSIHCVPKKGESVEVFMDDFSVFGDSFYKCLNILDKMLQHCKDAHLIINWEKCHFMVKERIMLGHKVSSTGLEVDKAKIDVISKLPPLLLSKVLEASSDMLFLPTFH
ncbi:reverse transcriptase domain-containing protein [Tanacetum coccineum]